MTRASSGSDRKIISRAIGQIAFGISEILLIHHKQCTKNAILAITIRPKKFWNQFSGQLKFFQKLCSINFFNTNTIIITAVDFYASQLVSVKKEWF